jgi:hypothetical protein
MSTTTHPRRGFFARLGAAAAMLAVGRELRADDGPIDDHDAWLDKLTGTYRQLFDFNAHGDGVPMIHMHNFIETLKSAYGATDKDINAVGTFYGGSTPLAWNDAMWEKYKVGAALKLEDPATKAPLARNWFYRPKQGDPVFFNGMLAAANVESLMTRGATFIMCNNAFRLWVGRIATATGGKPDDIAAEIKANLLPGVVVVPAMTIAINRAQGKGLSYMRQ